MNNNLESEFFNLGKWTSEKFKYHLKSKHNKVKNMHIKFGQVWYCDLGYNISVTLVSAKGLEFIQKKLKQKEKLLKEAVNK